MKRNLIFSVVVFVMLMAFSVPAMSAPIKVGDEFGTVQITKYNGYLSAGPFFVETTEGAFAGYDFWSFCVERENSISTNTGYRAILNVEAVNGGSGPSPDPLNQESAYLYTKFLDNGYNGSAVQLAIWMIEEEGTPDSINDLTLANAYKAEAEAAVLSGTWKGFGNIWVLNISSKDANGNIIDNQDLLVRVPEPMSLILLGLGLLGLGFIRRK